MDGFIGRKISILVGLRGVRMTPLWGFFLF
jgi:hypothetical protein